MDLSTFRPERILLCQLRQIGDVLLSTPTVDILAKAYPQAEIHFFTESKCAPMLQNNPHIAKVWSVDKKKLPTLWHELCFYREVTRSAFDLVVDFQQLPRCRWVVGFSGAKVRLASEVRWYNRPLYTHSTTPKHDYAASFKAQTLAPLSLGWNGERPRLYLTEDEHALAPRLFEEMGVANSPVISMDISHRRATRRWPAICYARLVEGLAEQYPQARFFLPYGPGEERDVEELRTLCAVQGRLAIPNRVIGLRKLAACIERSVMHIGNCSAPRHMAVAVNTPTFTLLGATSTGWTFPSPEHAVIHTSLPCQPCNKNTCPRDLECLTLLTPEKVLPKVLEHIRQFAAL